jgi:Lipase (class 3)
MEDASAIGPGLPNPVYDNLPDHLVVTNELPQADIAFVLAVCSSYAYGNAEAVAAIMDRLGLTRNRCRMISEYVDALFLTSTAFLIQSHDGRLAILCYRGTPPTSAITWVTDFQVEPVRVQVPAPSGGGFGEVHGGFYRNVRSTRFKIIPLLQAAIAGNSILDPDENPDDVPPEHELEVLYVTGHSLGGASAALFAALLSAQPSPYGGIEPKTYAEIGKRLRAVYTFGAPMVGDPAFADACNRDGFLGHNVIRYVYANDVVPRVPPKASGKFKHFGQEYRYWPPGRHGRWHQSPPRKQLRSVLQVVTAPLAVVSKTLTATRHLPFRASLSDHFPQHYIDALTPERLRSEFGD